MSQLRRINSMPDPVRNQVASIRRTEIIELRNRHEELLRQVEAQEIENYGLKANRAKFDSALSKYEGGKRDFTENHRRELQQSRIELRSTGRKCRTLDNKMRATEDELREMKTQLRRYRVLIDKERPEDAEKLTERLRENEESISEIDLEIQDLQTEIESLTLSQQEEMRSEKLKHRQTKKQVQDLKEELKMTVTRLKETSKEVDLKNFYHFQKSSSSAVTLPLPNKSEKPNLPTLVSHRNSDSFLSCRQKGKLYAAKRRLRQHRKRESFQEASSAHQQNDATDLS